MKKFLFIALLTTVCIPVVSQELYGKKLLKKAASYSKTGKEEEARKVLLKNYTPEDKYASNINLEIGKLYAKAKMLDSAHIYFDSTANGNNSKLKEDLESARKLVKNNKEQYQIEILSGWRIMDKKTDLESAISAFESALKLDVGNYEAYQGIGEVLTKQGKNKEAMVWYAKAITKYFPSNEEKAHCYEHMAISQVNLQKTGEAINYCNKGLMLNSKNKGLLFIRAKSYFSQNLFLEANTDFIKVIRLQPDNAEAWFYSGASYLKMQDYQNAVNSLSSCITYDSTNQNAYKSRGEAYVSQLDFENGKKDFQYLAKVIPSNFYAINAMGICDYYLRNFPESVKNFETVSSLNAPEYYKYNLVRAYMENDQNKEALIICKEWAQSNRGNLRYNVVHIKTLMNLNKFKEAQTYLEESMKMNAFVVEYLELAKEIYERSGYKRAAKDAASQIGSIQINPINQDLLF